ncbi:hypothetical protein LT493_24135 [Streptomyces tricolor]|nr:hypothetical protein [Streptomyces tricolor]
MLHRPTGTGYALRMTGIGDNFQLHTLLADVLIGGGHLPGRALRRRGGRPRDQPAQVHTTGSFNSVTLGTGWNEGTPGYPRRGRRTPARPGPAAVRAQLARGRFFPHMTGDLVPGAGARRGRGRTAARRVREQGRLTRRTPAFTTLTSALPAPVTHTPTGLGRTGAVGRTHQARRPRRRPGP